VPRLKLDIDDSLLSTDGIRLTLIRASSDAGTVKLFTTVARLVKSGDLAVWLSPRLMRKLNAYANQSAENTYGSTQVDDALLLSWLRAGGTVEPKVKWQVEPLPDNGGIYRILLSGGANEEGYEPNPSQ